MLDVARFVKIMVEEDTTATLSAFMGNTILAVVKPPENHRCLMMYDTEVTGEASAQPRIRLPNFRSSHLKKLVHAFVDCHVSCDTMPQWIEGVTQSV